MQSTRFLGLARTRLSGRRCRSFSRLGKVRESRLNHRTLPHTLINQIAFISRWITTTSTKASIGCGTARAFQRYAFLAVSLPRRFLNPANTLKSRRRISYSSRGSAKVSDETHLVIERRTQFFVHSISGLILSTGN